MAEPVYAADEFELPSNAAGESVVDEFQPPAGSTDVVSEFDPPPKQDRTAIIEDANAKINDWKAAFRNTDSPEAGFDLVKKWAGEKAAAVFKQNASMQTDVRGVKNRAVDVNTPLVHLPRANVPSLENTPDSMKPMQPTASVVAGAYNAAASFGESLTTPFNVATLGTFGALTKVASGTGIAAKAAQHALMALKVGFGAEMAKTAGEQAGKASVDLASPNVSLQQKVETGLAPLITGGLAILSAHSGATDAMAATEGSAPTNPNAVADAIESAPKPIEHAALGPEAAKLSERPGGPERLTEIKDALKSPDTVIQYSVWDKEMIPEGRDRVAQVDLINPKDKQSLGGIASTNRELLKELGVDAPPAPESLPPGSYTLDEIKAAIAKEGAKPDVASEFIPPEGLGEETPVVGLGAASPKEFQPVENFVTSIKNSVVDQEMKARGENPLMQEAAKDFGSTWNEAMKRIDENQNAADELISELRDKIRPATNVENAILLHRKIELENTFNKADRNLKENVGTPDSLAADRAAKQQALDDLLEINKISRATGSEQSAALNTRKLMAAQDFSLTSMLAKRSTAKGDVKLTPEEVAEVEAQHQKIVEAEKARDNSRTPEESNLNEAKADKAKSEFDDILEKDKYEQLTGIQKLRQQTVSAYDAARNLMTTGEFSFILRQGKMAAASRPIMTARAVPKAFQALFADEVTARALDIQTKSDPVATRAIENGVHFAEEGAKLSAREETLASKLADKIPLLRNFNQAGRVFLNKLRVDLYKSMEGGRELTPEQGEALAKYVNEATGRGSLGGLEKSSVELGRVLFAPRYLASRLQYAVGHSLWGGDLTTRRIIAKEYARTLVGLGVYYASLNAAFDALTDDPKKKPAVTMDPRSTDFGKVKIGNTRIDPLAGLSQVIVFGSRTATGEKITAAGNLAPLRGKIPYGGEKWTDVAATFARSKLHPLPGAVVNIFNGTDLAGNEATLTNQATNLIAPLTYIDIYQALEEQDLPPGVAASLLAMLGEGLQTYSARNKAVKQMGVAPLSSPTKKQITLPSGKKVNVAPAPAK